MDRETMSWDPEEEPPMVENWSYNDGSEAEIPSLYGRFENDWRFEIKPIDGQTFYTLGRPLDDASRDEWARDAGPEGWSFIGFDRILDDLLEQLHTGESLASLVDGETDVVKEYGRFFEMLEREGL